MTPYLIGFVAGLFAFPVAVAALALLGMRALDEDFAPRADWPRR